MYKEEKEALLQLLLSKDETNRWLGLTLVQSQNIDLSDWERLLQIDIQNGGDDTIPTKEKIWSSYMYNWVRYSKSLNLRFGELQDGAIPPFLWTLWTKNEGYFEHINLTSNPLTRLPEGICQHHPLKKLSVCRAQLTDLPDALSNLPYLQELHLSDNHFRRLPEVLFRLKKLTHLSLDNNHLEELPEKGWEQLKDLRWLSLSGVLVKKIPERLRFCKDLEYLNLNGCGLEKLPEWLQEFPRLHTLCIENNKLTELPLLPVSLQKLYMGYNPFYDAMSVGNVIRHPEQLSHLSAAGIGLNTVPDWIYACKKLYYLSLDRNPLHQDKGLFPQSQFGIYTWAQVRELHLNYCGFTELPQRIHNHNISTRDYFYIYLQGNYIQRLPFWVRWTAEYTGGTKVMSPHLCLQNNPLDGATRKEMQKYNGSKLTF